MCQQVLDPVSGSLGLSSVFAVRLLVLLGLKRLAPLRSTGVLSWMVP